MPALRRLVCGGKAGLEGVEVMVGLHCSLSLRLQAEVPLYVPFMASADAGRAQLLDCSYQAAEVHVLPCDVPS